ncbi:endonuclease III domain-containing protein [Methanobacterium alcaliphilum]|uniref:endonuclease III domain-containing protein n=1 Tax=Methanobacterium alcaliphilum TaxID=392018 RepID=UPI00200B25D3|nr:endonuclease III [Methanobacterium alcaliphilum]MCK9150817.1 endonuclease III [Methanobacterium alcaliphilum]
MPERIAIIMEKLRGLYKLRLFEDGDPYRVLIRTILSQRTRDENTDQASEELFAVYPEIDDVAAAPEEKLQKLVKKAGFYRVKSKRIKEVSQILLEDFGGIVPDTMEELLKLPGVGRKTANCVLVYAFQKPAIPVDTHVHRISNRIGLVKTKTPDETEFALEEMVPMEYWIELNDLMVQFGQDICRPISPKHEQCPIADLCGYYQDILDQKIDFNRK